MGVSLAVIYFQSPHLLWGISLIAIPIIVHLFNLRRAKRIEFSNISLLKQVQEESTSKKRPIELLVLFFRILAMTLIVLAFAQPIYQDEPYSDDFSNDVLLYLDNSTSMSVQNLDGSNFDNAYSIVKGIVESYPEGTDFRLLENSYNNSISTRLSRTALINELNTIDLVGIDRLGKEIVGRKSGFELQNVDTYLISDFNAVDSFDSFISDSTSNYYLIPLEVISEPNYYIDSVYLANTFYSGEFSNNLVIDIKSTNTSNGNANLRILNNDQLLGTAEVRFDNNLESRYVYELPNSIQDFSRLSIEIDATDQNFDNTFYLSINELETVSILEVYASNSNQFVQSLFSDNELFNFSRSSVTALDNSSFDNANVVVVNELSGFSNQFVNQINSFLQREGRLIVIPNTDMSLSEFSKIGINVLEDDNAQIELDPVDFNNPFFEGIFEEELGNFKMPFASTQWRLVNFEFPLLYFKNGRPFLSKIEGENTYFMASSLSTDNSSFANHALFVPIMYKLAFGSQSSANRLYYFTDSESISYPVKNESSNDIYKLVNSELEIIPDQRIIDNSIFIEIPKDQISLGQYYLIADEDTLGVMSFNLPKSESEFDEDIQEKMREAEQYPHIQVLDLSSENEARSFVNDTLIGKNLWKHFLLVALIFLFAEIILIRYL